MDLLSLPEHILVKICRYSDFKSKLNLMVKCKFFNDFIGRDPELCKDFELVLRDEYFECQSDIRSFTRRVSAIWFQMEVNRENFAEISALLTSIGETVSKMHFSFDAELKHFWKLISLTPNIEELGLSNFDSHPTESLPPIPHKFKKLKTLKLNLASGISESLLDIFKDVTSLEELEIQDNFDFVLKQLNLKSLQIRIGERLGPLPEIRELQLVNLRIFVFSDFSDFENLESFVKTQKKIGNFKMSFGEPNVVFDRIMTHVFGLVSLRMVDIYNVELMTDLPEMRNDHVRTLRFHSCNSTESLRQYLRVFPKLTDLRVSAQKRLSPETILSNQ
jgi:hypothetical protein